MIKINLVPIDELENPLWFIPDISVFIIVAMITYLGFTNAISSIEDQISIAEEKKGKITEQRGRLSSDVQEYNLLTRRIKKLEMQLSALDQITVTNFKFMPIIVLEHLQNLKPQGLWFRSLKFGNAESDGTLKTTPVELSGNAFDYLVVAEFLSNLRATEEQKIDPLDLRSQIYFNNLNLTKAKMPDDEKASDSRYPDIRGVHEFDVVFDVNQRDAAKISRPGDVAAAWNIDLKRFASYGAGPLKNAY